MNKIIKQFLLNQFDKHIPAQWYSNFSYSQEGEDRILASFFEDKKGYIGTYVDIGAHKPFRFSNTAIFYKRGWRGMNVEPTYSNYIQFNKHRPKDRNIWGGVSAIEGHKTLYCMSDSALNTFDYNRAIHLQKTTKYKIVESYDVEMFSLDTLFSFYNKPVDILNIDCEGMDEEIIISFDIPKFLPKLILLEDDTQNITHLKNGKICNYLEHYYYHPVAKTKRSVIYTKW